MFDYVSATTCLILGVVILNFFFIYSLVLGDAFSICCLKTQGIYIDEVNLNYFVVLLHYHIWKTWALE